MYIFMLRMMITECNICSWLQRWIRQKNALIPCTTEYRLKVEMQWNDIYDNVCCIHCIYAFWLVAHIICFFRIFCPCTYIHVSIKMHFFVYANVKMHWKWKHDARIRTWNVTTMKSFTFYFFSFEFRAIFKYFQGFKS